MRRRKRIDVRHFDPNPDHPFISQLEPLLEGTDVELTKYPIAFIIENIYAETDIYDSVMTCIRDSGIAYAEFERREYTKQEMKDGQYFLVNLLYPWEGKGNFAEKYGTLYDESDKCASCGLGKRQISDLIIDTKSMGKRDIVYNHPDIIITEHVKHVIENHQLTGATFRSVFDARSKQETSYYQLVPDNILGPMNIAQMKLTPSFCKVCSRGAIIRSEIIYPRASLAGATDFNYSSEYFNSGKYHSQRFIVSANVLKVFKENKIKIFEYEPISIVES